VALEALPLTPNGKVDRKALPAPDRSQTEETKRLVKPRNKLELQLTKIWEKILNVRPIGVKDNFFHVGGHSLLAVRLLSEIGKITGQDLPVAALFQAPTVEQLAGVLKQKTWSSPWSWLVPIQPYGSRIPYFQVHGTVNIVHYLGPDQPYYELDYHGTDGGLYPVYKTTEQKAADYIREMRSVHPHGPYLLCGFSFGGLVALEMGRQLLKQGEEIPLLFLLDPSVPVNYLSPKVTPNPSIPINRHSGSPREEAVLPPGPITVTERLQSAFTEKFRGAYAFSRFLACKAHLALGRPVPKKMRRFYISQLYQRASHVYSAEPYPGPVVLYHTHKDPHAVNWKALFVGELEIHHLAKGHMDFLEEPHVQVWARRLVACLDRIHAARSISG
jgi:aspartate racemase